MGCFFDCAKRHKKDNGTQATSRDITRDRTKKGRVLGDRTDKDQKKRELTKFSIRTFVSISYETVATKKYHQIVLHFFFSKSQYMRFFWFSILFKRGMLKNKKQEGRTDDKETHGVANLMILCTVFLI